MREHEIDTEAVIHEEKLLYENTRKRKPTLPSDTLQNEGELRVRVTTDTKRRNLERRDSKIN